jgi:RimJ/RimL family protein N-acetyltransferase
MGNSLDGDRLYTPRLYLRRIQLDDLPLVCRWSRDAAACGSYLTPEGYCPAQLAAQLQSGSLWRNRERIFLIDRRRAQSPLGTIHYWMRQDLRDTAVMAVKIALAHQRNHGYGTEAQKYLIIHLFNQLGVRAVEMYTDVDNHPQQRCLHKLGFQVERSLTYADHGVERTGHLFQLTADDFVRHPVYQYHYD